MILNGKQSKKEKLKERIIAIAENSSTLEELEKSLEYYQITTYRRKGKFQGVVAGKRKFRLTTLIEKEKLKELLDRKQQKPFSMQREITEETVNYYIKSLGLNAEELLDKPTERNSVKRERVLNKIFKEFTSCSYSSTVTKSFYTKVRIGNRYHHHKFKSVPDYDSIRDISVLTNELQRYSKGRKLVYENAKHALESKKRKEQEKSKSDERER